MIKYRISFINTLRTIPSLIDKPFFAIKGMISKGITRINEKQNVISSLLNEHRDVVHVSIRDIISNKVNFTSNAQNI